MENGKGHRLYIIRRKKCPRLHWIRKHREMKNVIGYTIIRIINKKNLSWSYQWKFKLKNSKRIFYDSRQWHFTTYPNFQEFVNAKKVICKCGHIISLGINYQVANFKRHSESNNCNFLINNQPSVKAFFTKVTMKNISLMIII